MGPRQQRGTKTKKSPQREQGIPCSRCGLESGTDSRYWVMRSPSVAVLQIEQLRVAGVAGLFDERAAKELRVAQVNILVPREVEVHDEVDFVAHVGAGFSRGIGADRYACGVIKGVLGAIEPEDVVLDKSGNPLDREECRL